MSKEAKKKRSVIVRVVMLPLLPWKWTWNSMRSNIGNGVKTIQDLNAQLTKMRRSPKICTFAEAMARRPPDALSLGEIESICLFNKRIALFFWLLSMTYSLASFVPNNYFGVVLGLLFSAFCLLFAFKYQHRLWQIRVGRKHPDRELGSIKQFVRTPGWIAMLFSPELFNV